MTEKPGEPARRSQPRWSEAYHAKADTATKFWKDYLKGTGRQACFVQAIGFDPRGAAFLESLDDTQRSDISVALTLELEYKKNQADIDTLVEANRKSVEKHLGKARVLQQKISIATDEKAGTRKTQTVVRQFLEKEAKNCTDIIIDINSMPKSVAMTAVAVALRYCDRRENQHRINLFVVVLHDPELDSRIRSTDIFFDPFLHAEFLSGFENENTDAIHSIWMPILGEGRANQVKKIQQAKWAPQDILPVVPSPSRDPKAADRLLLEYGGVLNAEEGSPTTANVLRVSEENPIEAYEGFLSTIQEFVRVYEVLGGCRVLVSSHSTKLLSLAALMAVYEARQGTCPGASYAFVEGGGHKYEGTPSGKSQPYVVWLTGEPFAN